jgi:hypothetical protein
MFPKFSDASHITGVPSSPAASRSGAGRKIVVDTSRPKGSTVDNDTYAKIAAAARRKSDKEFKRARLLKKQAAAESDSKKKTELETRAKLQFEAAKSYKRPMFLSHRAVQRDKYGIEIVTLKEFKREIRHMETDVPRTIDPEFHKMSKKRKKLVIKRYLDEHRSRSVALPIFAVGKEVRVGSKFKKAERKRKEYELEQFEQQSKAAKRRREEDDEWEAAMAESRSARIQETTLESNLRNLALDYGVDEEQELRLILAGVRSRSTDLAFVKLIGSRIGLPFLAAEKAILKASDDLASQRLRAYSPEEVAAIARLVPRWFTSEQARLLVQMSGQCRQPGPTEPEDILDTLPATNQSTPEPQDGVLPMPNYLLSQLVRIYIELHDQDARLQAMRGGQCPNPGPSVDQDDDATELSGTSKSSKLEKASKSTQHLVGLPASTFLHSAVDQTCEAAASSPTPPASETVEFQPDGVCGTKELEKMEREERAKLKETWFLEFHRHEHYRVQLITYRNWFADFCRLQHFSILTLAFKQWELSKPPPSLAFSCEQAAWKKMRLNKLGCKTTMSADMMVCAENGHTDLEKPIQCYQLKEQIVKYKEWVRCELTMDDCRDPALVDSLYDIFNSVSFNNNLCNGTVDYILTAIKRVAYASSEYAADYWDLAGIGMNSSLVQESNRRKFHVDPSVQTLADLKKTPKAKFNPQIHKLIHIRRPLSHIEEMLSPKMKLWFHMEWVEWHIEYADVVQADGSVRLEKWIDGKFYKVPCTYHEVEKQAVVYAYPKQQSELHRFIECDRTLIGNKLRVLQQTFAKCFRSDAQGLPCKDGSFTTRVEIGSDVILDFEDYRSVSERSNFPYVGPNITVGYRCLTELFNCMGKFWCPTETVGRFNLPLLYDIVSLSTSSVEDRQKVIFGRINRCPVVNFAKASPEAKITSKLAMQFEMLDVTGEEMGGLSTSMVICAIVSVCLWMTAMILYWRVCKEDDTPNTKQLRSCGTSGSVRTDHTQLGQYHTPTAPSVNCTQLLNDTAERAVCEVAKISFLILSIIVTALSTMFCRCCRARRNMLESRNGCPTEIVHTSTTTNW